MLSLIGAGFLAISLIDFLRQVDAVIAAGRPAVSQRMMLLPPPRTGPPGPPAPPVRSAVDGHSRSSMDQRRMEGRDGA